MKYELMKIYEKNQTIYDSVLNHLHFIYSRCKIEITINFINIIIRRSVYAD